MARVKKSGISTSQKTGLGGTVIERYINPLLAAEDEEEEQWDQNKDYEVDRVVEEHVDMAGNRFFKIAWLRWERKKDKSNTTWEPISVFNNCPQVLEEWNRVKKKDIQKRREKYAKTGYPIELFTQSCTTRFNTTLMELGIDLDLAGKLPDDLRYPSISDAWEGMDWEKEAQDLEKELREYAGNIEDDEMETDPLNITARSHSRNKEQAENTRRETSNQIPVSTFRGPLSAQKRHQTLNEDSIQRRRPRDESQESDFPRKKQKGKEISPDLRGILQAKWDAATVKIGAAPVILVNDEDDEQIPQSVEIDVFEYVENGPYDYINPQDKQDQEILEFVLRCQCDDCDDSHCQYQHHDLEQFRERNPTYNSEGLIMLNLDDPVQVVECNDKCSCGSYCQNRVAQRFRDIPLEVFKTKKYGWGVRSTSKIPKGKVLGLYTGILVRTVDKGSEDYTFALDFGLEQPYWHVNALKRGNWSRFLNHNAHPNLRVYTVVFDSVSSGADPEAYRPRLAFAAREDIPAGTELTIDYTPGKGQKKWKPKA